MLKFIFVYLPRDPLNRADEKRRELQVYRRDLRDRIGFWKDSWCWRNPDRCLKCTVYLSQADIDVKQS